MLKTSEYFYIEGDVLLLEGDKHYYYDLESLCNLLGLNQDAQLGIIEEDDNLLKDFEQIEVTYRNNKKATLNALKAERLVEWLFKVDENNAEAKWREDIRKIKDEAVRLVNEHVLKESALSGQEIHSFRNNERDARHKREKLEQQVKDLSDEVKKQKKLKETADANLEKGEDIHDNRTKSIDSKKKLQELEPQLEEAKKELKKQEERHRSFLAKNNIGRNMLVNLFTGLKG